MSYGPTDVWPPTWTCKEIQTASPAATGLAARIATQVLWSLSGRQFGTTTMTLRPCRRDCYATLASYLHDPLTYPSPALIGGAWINLGCGTCGPSGCACTTLSEAVLPGPVHSIVQVKVDGAVLGSSAYRVDDSRLLVRLDGGQWPLCNNLLKADTELGTWSVTAKVGEDVPEAGLLAAGELACEILKGFEGKDCSLPERVQSLVRQGVSITYPEPAEFLSDGKLGLVWGDRFIAAANPAGLTQRGRTWSVDRMPARRVGI